MKERKQKEKTREKGIWGKLTAYHQKDHMFGNLPLKDCLFAI
jgi:hypothetical protein